MNRPFSTRYCCWGLMGRFSARILMYSTIQCAFICRVLGKFPSISPFLKKSKVLTRSIIFFPVLLLSAIASASKVAAPELVLDMVNQAVLPHRFQTTQQALPSGVPVTGLRDLAVAGTSQFSEKGLREITHYFKPPFIIIDLRQESHGFIDGNAVTWSNKRNNVNQGKMAAQIRQDEKQWLLGLQAQRAIPVIANAKDTARHMIYLPNKDIQSERQLVKKRGLGYQRFFITDHSAPNTTTVDEFIRFYQGLPKGTKLLFHCRGGAGRTTTFLMMVDMLRNAKQVSFEDIVKRQMLLGGKDLFRLPLVNDYRHTLAKQRQVFLQKFYQYCRSNEDNYHTSWSEWASKHRR